MTKFKASIIYILACLFGRAYYVHSMPCFDVYEIGKRKWKYCHGELTRL